MVLMKNILLVVAVAVLASASAETCLSPNGKGKLEFTTAADGGMVYSYAYDGETVLKPSRLGFSCRKWINLTNGFEIVKVERATHDETWRPVWGEESEIRDRHNEMLVTLRRKVDPKDPNYPRYSLSLRFRVFDDGVGFRYEFPLQWELRYFQIIEELTEFNLPCDPMAWWIPLSYYTQEFSYTASRLSELPAKFAAASKTAADDNPGIVGVQTALMLKYPTGLYVNLHEAACIDYATMHLKYDAATGNLMSHLTPDASGCKGWMQAPRTTPWRTVIVGRKATDILASRITLNLNEPCKLADTSWIKPMKYVGVWWGMITGKWGWNYTDELPVVDLKTVDYTKTKPSGRHGATTARVKSYIDFAAEHGMDGVLVEGWNVGWEDWAGNEKEYVFDFLTPYPDFDLPAIRDYAAAKKVQMIMHHETSSSVRNYERHLAAAYDFMVSNGYHAVKSGYVGNIVPHGENHYSQWMNNHYLHCITEAAKRKIMVNAHEATRPTGLCRTWPNLIGNESARGTEYQAFGGTMPGHTAILPFTRLIGGPMDYTPGIFEFDLSKVNERGSGSIPSTICGQLALYVTLYSPLQMACDLPENYEKFPDAFRFIEEVPCEWSKTLYLEGEPMEYVTIARRVMSGEAWYVGGVTDTQEHKSKIALSFLDPGLIYFARIYEDAPDASYLANKQKYVITEKQVTAADTLALRAAPGGGFAVSIEPLEE